jgi:hypothetical protein
MEHFFTPSRHLYDRYGFPFENWGFTEVKLVESIEALLNHSWDWSDLLAFVTTDEGYMGKIIWITEDTFIWVEDSKTTVEFEKLECRAMQRATMTSISSEIHALVLAKAVNSLLLSAGASSVFWHAVSTSHCVKLKLEPMNNRFELRSLLALLQFSKTSPSLKLLELEGFAFEEDHCRALATLERTSLEVTFEECDFDAQGAKDTFIEWLRHSQVVTKLESCTMEDSTISAMSGNSSVKSFSMSLIYTTTTGGYSDYSDFHIRSLAEALPGNQGIENLCVSLSEETSSLLLRSLWAHPRIQTVSLSFFYWLSDASKTSVMDSVLRLAQCNTMVHTINLQPDDAKDEKFFQNSILPRLEMNRNSYRDQRRALQRAGPSIRGQLLGRALHVVRYNPDLLFRFLSENVPAFVRSDEDGPITTSGQKRKARS